MVSSRVSFWRRWKGVFNLSHHPACQLKNDFRPFSCKNCRRRIDLHWAIASSPSHCLLENPSAESTVEPRLWMNHYLTNSGQRWLSQLFSTVCQLWVEANLVTLTLESNAISTTSAHHLPHAAHSMVHHWCMIMAHLSSSLPVNTICRHFQTSNPQ